MAALGLVFAAAWFANSSAGSASKVATSSSASASPSSSDGPSDPEPTACQRSGQQVCDDASWQQLLNEQPLSKPLRAGTPMLTPAQIRDGALKLNPKAAGAVYLAYLSPAEAHERFDLNRSTTIDPSRPIYVVTMPDDNSKEGGPAGRTPANVSTYVVDAATGTITDWGMGARWLSQDGNLPDHPVAP